MIISGTYGKSLYTTTRIYDKRKHGSHTGTRFLVSGHGPDGVCLMVDVKNDHIQHLIICQTYTTLPCSSKQVTLRKFLTRDHKAKGLLESLTSMERTSDETHRYEERHAADLELWAVLVHHLSGV